MQAYIDSICKRSSPPTTTAVRPTRSALLLQSHQLERRRELDEAAARESALRTSTRRQTWRAPSRSQRVGTSSSFGRAQRVLPSHPPRHPSPLITSPPLSPRLLHGEAHRPDGPTAWPRQMPQPLGLPPASPPQRPRSTSTATRVWTPVGTSSLSSPSQRTPQGRQPGHDQLHDVSPWYPLFSTSPSPAASPSVWRHGAAPRETVGAGTAMVRSADPSEKADASISLISDPFQRWSGSAATASAWRITNDSHGGLQRQTGTPTFHGFAASGMNERVPPTTLLPSPSASLHTKRAGAAGVAHGEQTQTSELNSSSSPPSPSSAVWSTWYPQRVTSGPHTQMLPSHHHDDGVDGHTAVAQASPSSSQLLLRRPTASPHQRSPMVHRASPSSTPVPSASHPTRGSPPSRRTPPVVVPASPLAASPPLAVKLRADVHTARHTNDLNRTAEAEARSRHDTSLNVARDSSTISPGSKPSPAHPLPSTHRRTHYGAGWPMSLRDVREGSSTHLPRQVSPRVTAGDAGNVFERTRVRAAGIDSASASRAAIVKLWRATANEHARLAAERDELHSNCFEVDAGNSFNDTRGNRGGALRDARQRAPLNRRTSSARAYLYAEDSEG